MGLKVRDYWIYKDYGFFHGHRLFREVFDKKIKDLVVGHMHPAITIRDKAGVKKERYKCFLVGKFKRKRLIILPSFFPLVEGQDVFIEDTNLGFKVNLKNFEVYVIGEKEVYEFGKLKNIGKL